MPEAPEPIPSSPPEHVEEIESPPTAITTGFPSVGIPYKRSASTLGRSDIGTQTDHIVEKQGPANSQSGGTGQPSETEQLHPHSLPAQTPERLASAPSPEEDDRAFSLLTNHSALDARANSYDRQKEVRCLPGTRADILDELSSWSKRENTWKDVRLLLLVAPTKYGKTTVLQTFADELLEHAAHEKNLIVTTFFFTKPNPKQDNMKRLIATLAYQVAVQSPAIRAFIVKSILKDQGVFSMALKHQARQLLIQPMEAAMEAASGKYDPSYNVIVVVDAVNDCSQDAADQTIVIRALCLLASSGLFRVAISSQPTKPMRSAKTTTAADTRHLELKTWAEAPQLEDGHVSV